MGERAGAVLNKLGGLLESGKNILTTGSPKGSPKGSPVGSPVKGGNANNHFVNAHADSAEGEAPNVMKLPPPVVGDAVADRKDKER